MGLVKVVGGFLGLWTLFYLVVYLSYLSPDQSGPDAILDTIVKDERPVERNLKIDIADTPFASHADEAFPSKHRSFEEKVAYVDYFEPAISTNPFLSTSCIFRTQQAREKLIAGNAGVRRSVGVVIPVRNENKNEVLKTVESIIKNSGNELQKIIIVDDFSLSPVDSWPEWAAYSAAANDRFSGMTGDVLQVLRLHHRNGVAKAKSFGAEHMLMEKIDVLVFLDGHVIVSKDWLIPLTTQLSKHEESIVYPAIDIIDGTNGDLIKSENAVGAFDWSLGFRWEILHESQAQQTKTRLPLSATDKDGHAVDADDVVTSPAAPGMFAINAKYYREIGGFDTTLFPWGQENVELSIRVWLCGGSVIRQPCSRVAHTYRHLYEDSSVNNGVTQEQIDRNVLSVAELWLTPHQRETVFQSRFTNRIPYHVEVSLDSRQLSEFLNVKMLRDEKCQSFDWFLSEVYPGLEADRENVEIGYKNHLSSKYLETSLAPLVEQYNKAASGTVMDQDEIAKLIKREGTPAELAFKQQKGQAVPPMVKEIILSPFEKHSELIRDTLICKDQPKLKPSDELGPCEKALLLDPNACTTMKSLMMFQCPQTCSMCGADGKICFDFYEHKCPEWAAEGQCISEEAEMRKTCRISCGFCTRQAPIAKAVVAIVPPALSVVEDQAVEEPDEAPGPGDVVPKEVVSDAKDTVSDPNAEDTKKDVLNHNAKPVMKEDLGHNVPPVMPDAADKKVVAVADALAPVTTSRVVNPFVAQEQYKSGLLPDPPVGTSGACGLNDKSHGNLLAYMDLAVLDSSVPAPKILCGIYTMEKNHATNVQATRETWGKKCDGFIAFSTVNDDLIPSLNILHEGDEHYDNMWQKSRSIWKYINEHFIDSFDYFLLGGDDMFYVVENLRHYLMSEEIKSLSAKNNGIFLGRRFWPADKRVFNSGGAGYILDKKALQVLAPFLDSPLCFAHQRGFWEDVNVANCLRVAGNIEPYDTRDSKERERFNPFTPGMHLEYRIPKKEGDWYPKYNPFLKEGYDCCSTESVSFHYCPADLTKQLYNYMYNCKDKHKNV